jgi:hypothetical protein
MQTLTVNLGRPIPLFPLSQAVLLPQVGMPLHIFEHRYRRMVSDVLDSAGYIAVARFDRPVGEYEYVHGRPPLKPVVCIGHVENYERVEDGRYLILLRGLCRARIAEEIDGRPYRQAYCTALDEPEANEADLADRREQIEQLLDEPQLQRVPVLQQVRRLIKPAAPIDGLIDLISAAVCNDTDQRYELLCEADTDRRGQWLVRQLRRLRHEGGQLDRFDQR